MIPSCERSGVRYGIAEPSDMAEMVALLGSVFSRQQGTEHGNKPLNFSHGPCYWREVWGAAASAAIDSSAFQGTGRQARGCQRERKVAAGEGHRSASRRACPVWSDLRREYRLSLRGKGHLDSSHPPASLPTPGHPSSPGSRWLACLVATSDSEC